MENDAQPPKDRKVVLITGAALALAAGLGGAVLIMAKDDGTTTPPPASQGGLVVEATRPSDDGLDPARPLRCFVSGEFVGEITLAECAERNGVATGSLDVGLDQSGALAAAAVAGTVLTPLPPETQAPVVVATPTSPQVSQPVQVSTATCWRYDGGWRQVGELGRGACAQTLFAGQCTGRGGALYGRWGEQTLRLVTGRVEISNDNRRFRTLVEQGPACSLPSVD